jgi:hypothetical protein
MRLVHAIVLAACLACRTTTPGGEEGAASGDSASGAGAEAPADTAAAMVELRTERAQYRPGDRVALTLVNRTEATWSFNPCTRTVERETGGAWAAVAEPGRACTMEAWLLEPRATRAAETELPPSLEGGRYRLVIALIREGSGTPPADRASAASAPFAVSP